MRLLLLFSALFVVGSAMELPVVMSLSIRAAGETMCIEEDGLVCKDCHTLAMCIGGEVMSTVACSDVSASQPYCNNGTCSSAMPADDDCGIQGNFTCTSEGYFPDPDDCTKYYICVGSPLTAYLNICPSSPKHVYNHAKGMCVRQILPLDCAKMSCKAGLVTEKVPYPKDANVYGLCFAGKMTVLKCKPGEQLNTRTGKCESTCNEEKLLPHEDQDKYIQCTYSSPNVYKPMVYKCPGNTIFDPEVLRCKTDPCGGSGGGSSGGGGGSGGGGSGGGSGSGGDPEPPENDPEATRKVFK